METFSALLAICAGNSPVPGEYPTQRPVTRSFDVFFDLPLNKLVSKHSWGWWFGTLSGPLWRHNNVSTICCSWISTIDFGVAMLFVTLSVNVTFESNCDHRIMIDNRTSNASIVRILRIVEQYWFSVGTISYLEIKCMTIDYTIENTTFWTSATKMFSNWSNVWTTSGNCLSHVRCQATTWTTLTCQYINLWTHLKKG